MVSTSAVTILVAYMKPFSLVSFSSAILGLCSIVIIGGCGISNHIASNAATPQTPATVPFAVTSISPTSVPAGAASLMLTVNGSGFESASVIQLNGASIPTQYVSSAQLTAVVPATSLVTGTMLSIAVLNGTATTASGGSAISLEVDNPAPVITGFSPTGLVTGASPLTVSVAGSGFVPGTVIQVNGGIRTTTYIRATQVSAALAAKDLAYAGSLALAAFNPAPGGGTSGAAALPVVNPNPNPSVISLTPSTVAAGKTNVTSVSVLGTGFVSGSLARVNGSARSTMVVSPTQLSFQLTVADQASSGLLTIDVVNPAPGGGTSGPATFTVTASAVTPVISNVTPAQITAGSGDTEIQVFGSNLDLGETVQWNGTNLPTTYASSNYRVYLIATVPANLLAASGTASIAVENASATPPISNSIALQIVNPPLPTLTSLSTTLVPTGAAATITLNGTAFTPTSTVAFNGINLPIT